MNKKKKKPLQCSSTKFSQCPRGVFLLVWHVKQGKSTLLLLSSRHLSVPWHVEKKSPNFFLLCWWLTAWCAPLWRKKKPTTGELYIWLLVPDDVKTGADPKPAAQRVPQRACFPFLCLRDIFLPRGTSGSRLTGGGSNTRRTRRTSFQSSEPTRAGGGWSGDPQQASLTAFGFTFHTSCGAAGEPPLCHVKDSVRSRTRRPTPDTVFWLARPSLSHNLPLGWRQA